MTKFDCQFLSLSEKFTRGISHNQSDMTLNVDLIKNSIIFHVNL